MHFYRYCHLYLARLCYIFYKVAELPFFPSGGLRNKTKFSFGCCALNKCSTCCCSCSSCLCAGGIYCLHTHTVTHTHRELAKTVYSCRSNMSCGWQNVPLPTRRLTQLYPAQPCPVSVAALVPATCLMLTNVPSNKVPPLPLYPSVPPTCRAESS